MIQTGIESRVKVQNIVQNQLPEFITTDYPKTIDFLKQYYISQEFQSGPIDLIDNLDQYLKVDNLTPEVVVGSTSLTADVSATDTTIEVVSTKGYPNEYGLFRIDDEIITYTGSTATSFTGCVRGFSAITSYHDSLNQGELIFSQSMAAPHVSGASVQNLSVLFLQQFYLLTKAQYTPGLEDTAFTPELNAGNFIKEARTLYQTKGTEESFRILFNVLYGETPTVVDLEQFLIKPSSANYVRRDIVVAEVLSGENPLNLAGQTIFRNDDVNTTASVSEVEAITRNGVSYFKFFIFVGFDEAFPTVTGNFNITNSSRCLDFIAPGQNIITVDSTIGFPEEGSLFVEGNVITYTGKTVNQFLGCDGVVTGIQTATPINASNTYYGFENSNPEKRVDFRVTGVLSNFISTDDSNTFSPGEKISVRSLGRRIENPNININRKEIFANSWIYNTSSNFEIVSFQEGPTNTLIVGFFPDKASLKIGDSCEIVARDNPTGVLFSNLIVTNIDRDLITLNGQFNLDSGGNYNLRRKIDAASSNSNVELEFDGLVANTQNVYDEGEFLYVASNSLPSDPIDAQKFSYVATSFGNPDPLNGEFSTIGFAERVSFVRGSRIVYQNVEGEPIPGLINNYSYYIARVNNRTIRLYLSLQNLDLNTPVLFGPDIPAGEHTFTLFSQNADVISPQKVLKKFPLNPFLGGNVYDDTTTGTIGMLVNGVEVSSFKSRDSVFFGPINSVDVLEGGSGYDIVNPPVIILDPEEGNGDAVIAPVIEGSITDVLVDPQDFDIEAIITIDVKGGNGRNFALEPILSRRRRPANFDARLSDEGGGVNTDNETITFGSPHGFVSGSPIIYKSLGNNPLGIGPFEGSDVPTGETLQEDATYFPLVISSNTIQLYQTRGDFNLGINTVGFTTAGTQGIQQFLTGVNLTLSGIEVINGGEGFSNRTLSVPGSNVDVPDSSIVFENHGFQSGELVSYEFETNPISGLTTANQYYILKQNDSIFRLCDAGPDGNDISNFERGRFVEFGNNGGGLQTFRYPDIEVIVEFSAPDTTGIIESTPIVRGSFVDAYVYDSGTGYGSNVINYHKRPQVLIQNGKDAQLSPVINNGQIVDVVILSSGTEFNSIPSIEIQGNGTGASFRAEIENQRISRVLVINPGSGYTEATLNVIPAGTNAFLRSNIRELRLNNNFVFNDREASDNTVEEAQEFLIKTTNNLQYTICGFNDTLFNTFGIREGFHSPIIGWAYDGNPIYGPFAFIDPSDSNSDIGRMRSGYTQDPTNIPNRPRGGLPNGSLVDDFAFTDAGDLDEYNGRFCVTPEFPDGVYAYFATILTDGNNRLIGQFPYFVGNQYRSPFIQENINLNQSFDFNNSSLIRNTFPYNLGIDFASNDFIVQSNRIINQITQIDSTTKGSVEGFEILEPGIEYKTGDEIIFDETESGGTGLIARVGEIQGHPIVNLDNRTEEFLNNLFIWNEGSVEIDVNGTIGDLLDGDSITVSGFSTSLSDLNNFFTVGGINRFVTSTISDIPSGPIGDIIDVYVTNIPNVNIESLIADNNGNTYRLLNKFERQSIIRVERVTGTDEYEAPNFLEFLPTTLTIPADIEFFESSREDKFFFNPTETVAVGNDTGTDVDVVFTLGGVSRTVSVPTQSIFLPDHPFQTGQSVSFNRANINRDALSVSPTTNPADAFQIPNVGETSFDLFVVRKSNDFISLVTNVGLTTDPEAGLYFFNNAEDFSDYSINNNLTQVRGNFDEFKAVASISTSHDLSNGDIVRIDAKSNLTTSVEVIYLEAEDRVIVNPRSFVSSAINVTLDEITINEHGLNTGEKVYFRSDAIPGGLRIGDYFIFRVDEDRIKLCETLSDSLQNPPISVDIQTQPPGNHSVSPVNPPLTFVRDSNIIFDLSDSSLQGFDFDIFYDPEFKNRFVSTGITSSFSVVKTGTPGAQGTLQISYSDDLPSTLYYSILNDTTKQPLDVDRSVINFNQISYSKSVYEGEFTIQVLDDVSFEYSLRVRPEVDNYNQSNTTSLKYQTSSQSASGGVARVSISSPGFGYDVVPVFKTINSVNGLGANILATSNSIGKLNQFTILNEGFEYSSDKTLSPSAQIPVQLNLVENANLTDIAIQFGGLNYTAAPTIQLIDATSRQNVDAGTIVASIGEGNSIVDIDIQDVPKGLSGNVLDVFALNNSNGISILSASSIFTPVPGVTVVDCTLVTPLNGFAEEPFNIGDEIFVENIDSTGGPGYNSSDQGYTFFRVTNYQNGGTANLRILTYEIQGTVDPGNISEDTGGNIVNRSLYPILFPQQEINLFQVSEQIEVLVNQNFQVVDLRITESNPSSIKVNGSYRLRVGDRIRGVITGSLATINEINESAGIFEISALSRQRLGWTDDVGKLDLDNQVIEDNDYYQNLSYTIKSNQEWETIVSPVNRLLHTSGLKNFADTQVIGIATRAGANNIVEFSDNIVDLTNELRVDAINNFDNVIDIEVSPEGVATEIEFQNKRLTSFFEVSANRPLQIDDISRFYSSSDSEIVEDQSTVLLIPVSSGYNEYSVQISNDIGSQLQFSELIILNKIQEGDNTLDSDFYVTTKQQVSNLPNNESLGEFVVERNVTNPQFFQLTFIPNDQFDEVYNIKVLRNTFSSFANSSGSFPIGFFNLESVTTTLSGSESNVEILRLPVADFSSVNGRFNLYNPSTDTSNYVEIFVNQYGVGQTPDIVAYSFDTNNSNSEEIVTFDADIFGQDLVILISNNLETEVISRSKFYVFGDPSIGNGTYTFVAESQPTLTARTARLESFVANVTGIDVVYSFSLSQFSSVKSTVRVSDSNGDVNLIQLLIVNDGTDVFLTQYPYLVRNNPLGIGDFTTQVTGSSIDIVFTPRTGAASYEVLSFNELFFTITDFFNTPLPLTYGNISEEIVTSQFIGLNRSELNRVSFPLEYEGIPITQKTVNPQNSEVLDITTGTFFVENHFFSTGEQLNYSDGTSFIDETSSPIQYSGGDLPSQIFAIQINANTFQVALTEQDAVNGNNITFTSPGTGNAHTFEMELRLSKSLISIDNIIQQPVAFSLLNYTVNTSRDLTDADTTFALVGISSIQPLDILKIDDEFMIINNVGQGEAEFGPITFNGPFNLVEVERGSLGTGATSHTTGSNAALFQGSYNISGDQIIFTQPPRGTLAGQVETPLNELDLPRSTFNGRFFLRSDYSTNIVYDNISSKFTGVDTDYTVTVDGNNAVGLGTSGGNGFVFINGIYQDPSTDNNPNGNFRVEEDTIAGITSLVFSGIRANPEDPPFISDFDVNQNDLPRGGLLVSIGSSGGLGIAPLVGAEVTAETNGSGVIDNLIINEAGSGYREPVSVAVTDLNGLGNGAEITATVNDGGVLSFNIVNGGTSYTEPAVFIDSPSYSNLPIQGLFRRSQGNTTQTGFGLSVTVSVGADENTDLFTVDGFEFSNQGFGFEVGDRFTAVGIVTAAGLGNLVTPLEFEVLRVFNDQFSAWQFGEVDFLDSQANLQDGIRTRFPLVYRGEIISVEANPDNPDSELVDLQSLLIVFVNGLLQVPGESYFFDGGSTYSFQIPPRPEDIVSVYFYKGSDSDSNFVDVIPTIKIGDEVRIGNKYGLPQTISQEERNVFQIIDSNEIETDPYTAQGIDEINQKPLRWTKQKVDTVIDGVFVSKARPGLRGQIYPSGKIIAPFSSGDTIIQVDDASLFNYEQIDPSEIDINAEIYANNPDAIQADLQTEVTGGAVSNVIINDGGSGYIGAALTASIGGPGNGAVVDLTITDGVIDGFNIVSGGSGYTSAPIISAVPPSSTNGLVVQADSILTGNGNITEISSPGPNQIEFTLETADLPLNQRIYIFDTGVGDGTISVDGSSAIIGIGTEFLDNVYEVTQILTAPDRIIVNVDPSTDLTGIATSGLVGRYSWGRIGGFTVERGIDVNPDGYTTSSGLSTYPLLQRTLDIPVINPIGIGTT